MARILVYINLMQEKMKLSLGEFESLCESD